MHFKKVVVVIIVLVLLSFILLYSFSLIKEMNNNKVKEIIQTKDIQKIIEIKGTENELDMPEIKQIGQENNLPKWQIEIPKISLIAPISEGTDLETLNEYVGHFKTTEKAEGNIGLAAHNRGYAVNYFQNLKKLEYGDKIIYTYGETEKMYQVISNIQISDTEWRYLENTTQNMLTLITCIENKPEYRRCVQATEMEGE